MRESRLLPLEEPPVLDEECVLELLVLLGLEFAITEEAAGSGLPCTIGVQMTTTKKTTSISKSRLDELATLK